MGSFIFAVMVGRIVLLRFTGIQVSNWLPDAMFWGLLAVVIGWSMYHSARFASRRIVPLPKVECANCGYPATHPTFTKCSECGESLNQGESSPH